MIFVAAVVNKAVKALPVDQRLQIGANQDVRARFPRFRITRHANRVFRSGRDSVIHVSQEGQRLVAACTSRLKVDGHKGCIIYGNARLFHRRDQKVVISVLANNGGKQFHQFLSPDRRTKVEPRSIPCDAHIKVAAKRRIPQVHWRAALPGSVFCGLRQAVRAYLPALSNTCGICHLRLPVYFVPIHADGDSASLKVFPMDQNASALADRVERTGNLLARAKKQISKRIIGQDTVVEQAIVALLCGGHALLVGAPGLAKTRLVDTLGTVFGLMTNRIQFTPDLMPADILGSEVLESAEDGTRNFKFLKGPVFTQLLMADEINRASPRTQSALLQAMQEHQVTIAGREYDLPAPFHVLATQNPIEQEGTYPLPEAQLDRFILQIDVKFPGRGTERDILIATTGAGHARAEPVFTPAELQAGQDAVRRMPVGSAVVEAILDVVRMARPEDQSAPDYVRDAVSWGPGPRAAQALMLATRARALVQGRLAPSIEDVAALARPVLTHRMALGFTARARGEELGDIIARLVATVDRAEAAA